MARRGLVPATPENKRMAGEFIDGVVPTGETDLAPSLERALSLAPEAVYVVTDAEMDRALVAMARQWNVGRRTRTHCIAFLYELDKEALQAIAAESGGQFRFVSEAQLERMFEEATRQPSR